MSALTAEKVLLAFLSINNFNGRCKIHGCSSHNSPHSTCRKLLVDISREEIKPMVMEKHGFRYRVFIISSSCWRLDYQKFGTLNKTEYFPIKNL